MTFRTIMDYKQPRIVIVGAGFSGLSAARFLKENDLDVIVLEARDRVGGRICTIDDPVHGKVDVGGAYVGPTQDHVLGLAKEYGLELYYVNDKQQTIIDFQYCWLKYKGVIPPIRNPFVLLDLNHTFRTFENMAQQVPKHAPWLAEKAAEWDSITMKEFIDKTCWTQFVKDMMKVFAEVGFCAEPHEISLLSALWYLHTGGGISRSTGISNGAQERKFVDGAGTLSQKMADSLGSCVKLSCPVINIKQTESGAIVTDAHGTEYQADYVILATPPALWCKITFEPPLPADKSHLIQRMPMGSIIKTMTYYSEAFWKDMDLNGGFVSNHGPVRGCLEDTKPDGSHPAIVGFILANEARELMHLTESERKEAVCRHYAKAFRCDKFLKPVGYIEKNWIAEEYSGGCYSAVAPPGVLSTMGRCLRKPFDKIHFAGTITATEWAGYMDGAIQAGGRAGREIVQRIKNIPMSDVEERPPMKIDRHWLENWLPSVSGMVWGFIAGTVAIAVYYFTGEHI